MLPPMAESGQYVFSLAKKEKQMGVIGIGKMSGSCQDANAEATHDQIARISPGTAGGGRWKKWQAPKKPGKD